MSKQFTVNRRRLTVTLAISSPLAIAAGLLIGEWQWRQQPAIAIPEMCITSTPDGESTVSPGVCQPDSTVGI